MPLVYPAEVTRELQLLLGGAVESRFGCWWDTQAEKDKGGGVVRHTRNGSVTGVRASRDGVPDRMTLARRSSLVCVRMIVLLHSTQRSSS